MASTYSASTRDRSAQVTADSRRHFGLHPGQAARSANRPTPFISTCVHEFSASPKTRRAARCIGNGERRARRPIVTYRVKAAAGGHDRRAWRLLRSGVDCQPTTASATLRSSLSSAPDECLAAYEGWRVAGSRSRPPMDRQLAGAGSTERRGHAVARTERLRDGERLVELLRGEGSRSDVGSVTVIAPSWSSKPPPTQ
jgi:hypothetical protein